jgi:hypothetical protein
LERSVQAEIDNDSTGHLLSPVFSARRHQKAAAVSPEREPALHIRFKPIARFFTVEGNWRVAG